MVRTRQENIPWSKKIKNIPAIFSLVKREKKRGKKIVTTNGCFDILHIGHAQNLAFAKSLGDILLVGVNSDKSVRANKGPARPIMPARERAGLLAALAPVDYVFIFDDTTPLSWLKKIEPHVHVKGSERQLVEIKEKEVVEHNGGKVILAPYNKGCSTTEIINRIITKYPSRDNQ